MKQIAAAIIAVMQTVKGMEKNSRVGAGTRGAYDGTKDKDVKEVMNKALAENGLCILPIDVQAKTTVSRWEEIDQYSKSTPKAIKTKQSIFTEVTTKYLLLHTSGESIELVGYGHGVDPSDKGAGKSTTYALKNCLLLMFLIPVGKMDDTDTTHSQDHATPQKKTPKKKEKMTTDLIKEVVEWAIKKKMTIKNIDDLYEMTAVQKASVLRGLKAAK